jgi:hypothetical protein
MQAQSISIAKPRRCGLVQASILGKIAAVIFEIAEQQVLRFTQEDRIVAVVKGLDDRQNLWPNYRVQSLIFLKIF